MTTAQQLLDERIETLLSTARKDEAPVDELLASLREETALTALYWVLVERAYQLALDNGVFLNSNAFLKLREKAVLRTEGVTPTSTQEVPDDKPRRAITENVTHLLGTVGQALERLGLEDSLRALAYELLNEDEEFAEPSFLRECERAGLTSVNDVFSRELQERWGDDDYIDISQEPTPAS